jgi:LysE type translocator
MPDTHLYLAFVLAVTILMLIPGPNVALIVANSVTYGFRYGVLTVAGTSAAMVVQLGLTVLGMTELLGTLGAWFEWIRWIGVAYLIYLGVTQWRAAPVNLAEVARAPIGARDVHAGAAGLVDQSEDAVLLWGVLPAIRRHQPRCGRAGRHPLGNLPAAGGPARRLLGTRRRPRAGAAGDAWTAQE